MKRIALCLLLLCGCSTSNRLSHEAGDEWPYLGWDTNAPSLEPMTNAPVPPPVFKDGRDGKDERP